MQAPASFSKFQRRGQEVLRLRPALMSYWRAWVVVIVLVGLWGWRMKLLSNVSAETSLWPTILLSIALIPVLSGIFLHRYTRSYEVENLSVLRTTVGLISRAKREYVLSDKVQVDAVQSVPARLLNYGTLGFWAGDDKSRMEWHAVPDPDKTVAYIRSLKIAGTHTNVEPPEEMANPPASSSLDGTHPSHLRLPVPPPSPPASAVFSDDVIALPNTVWIMRRIVGEPEALVENFQWVERGDPILKVVVGTGGDDGGVFKQTTFEYEEVIVRSPATGLIMNNYMVFNGPDANPDPTALTVLILPIASDPEPENGVALYGALKDAVWRNRDYLFRDGYSIKFARKHRARWACVYNTDSEISDMLDEMCARNCLRASLLPERGQYLEWALEKHPNLLKASKN